MTDHEIFSRDELRRIKALEIAQSYAEFKKREGSLEGDIINWADLIIKFIETGKAD